jgi:SAM-dependent methyltransferase
MDPSAYKIQADLHRSHWWFRSRRRILDRMLTDLHADLPPTPRILDVGAGTGPNGEVLCRYGQCVALDLEPVALSLSQDSGHDFRVCADVNHLPFSDNSFDLVVCLDLLEHLEDDLAGTRELKRVVRPGGLVLSFAPAFESLWGLQDDVSHHHRRYRKKQLVKLFESSGLEVLRATYFNTLLFAPIFAARQLLNVYRPPGLQSENQIGGRLTQRILEAIFSAEAPLLSRFDLPFGVSLAVVARQKAVP